MTDVEVLGNEVRALLFKAGKETDAIKALQFSQAACNAANAIAVLQDVANKAK
jgi:hypothetical protein